MRSVDLVATGGLDVGSVRDSMVSHAVPGSEVAVATEAGLTYRRLLTLGRAPTEVTLDITSQGITVVLAEGPPPGEPGTLQEAAEVVTWWFDLDTAPRVVSRHLEEDPLLGPMIAERPAVRPLRHPDGFEAAIGTVLGQQVSLAAGRLFGARLRAAYSPDGGFPATPSVGRSDGGWHGTSDVPDRSLLPFPSPAALASAPVEELRAAVGLTRSRAATVQAVARLFEEGFRLDGATDPMEARRQLLALPGVGSWTVEYLALRVLGDPDAFPASDAVIRRALGGLSPPAATAAAEAWRPYRSWAAAHLWAAASSSLPVPPSP
ncbi:MAG TPA: AlkA N-terminal domain-containing protein [Ornithinicoccus sp.]|nr:AlkA N-terminal domain-containing protein [Ornithinicoccus sp.]